MAQDITLLGATYRSVPSVLLPKTGGGTAKFVELSNQNGKVVKNGELISQYGQVVFSNGLYDTTECCQMTVAVSNKETDIIAGTISGKYENDEATAVGNSGFRDRTLLTEISLPNAVSIGNYAFNGCSALETADIPSAKTIGSNAFQGCANLETADTSSAETIGSNAFQGCSMLSDIDLSKVKTIGGSAFRDCAALTEVDAPKCSSIASSYAFYHCTSITRVKLPLCGAIQTTTFQGCTGLTSADIGGGYAGSAARRIYANGFNGCSALTALILRETKAIYALSNVNALSGTPIQSGSGYIYVPNALKTTYQSATNWSTYSSQFRSLESYTVDGTVSGALDPNKI